MTPHERITSRDNRRLVQVRKVRDGEISEQIFVEGRRLVAEALNADIDIIECFVAAGFRDTNLLGAIAKRSIPMTELPEKLFPSIADTNNSQGIIVIALRPDPPGKFIDFRFQDASSTLPLIVFLNEINNPSNLGAIVRTAEAAGIAGVVVSPRSADAYSPKALRSAMGSGFRLRIWTNVELDEALALAISEKAVVVAADARSGTDHTNFDWTSPTLLVFGSEAHGLTPADLAKIDKSVAIPMMSGVESLNLAVSAGVILFEARRQNS